jgi:hypothetical protein
MVSSSWTSDQQTRPTALADAHAHKIVRVLAQSEEEAKQLQGLKALQGLGKSSDKVYGPLQRTFQVAADSPATLVACRRAPVYSSMQALLNLLTFICAPVLAYEIQRLTRYSCALCDHIADEAAGS